MSTLIKDFQFRVKAQDGGSPPLSSNVSVKILIQDQNDNAPQVLYPVKTGGSLVAEMVPRSADVGYLVTKVVAVDVDSGQNAWLSYKLQKATDRALFEVGLQNGEIRTIRQVTDKDAVKQRLTVIVEDNGQPSRSATVIVNVAVADSFPEVLSEFTDFTHDKEYNDNLTFYLVLALAVVSFLFITCLVVIISVKIYRWRQSRILYHSSLPVIPYYPPRYSDTLGTGTLQHVYNYEVCRTTDSRKSDCKVGNAGSQNVLIMDPSSTGTMQRMQIEKSILDEPDSPLEDQNDNAPQVLYPVQTGGSLVAEMVPRSVDVGYLVTKVVAVDVDSGQNAWLSYKLQKATDRALFEVGLQNGEIRTIRQVTDKDAVKQRLTVIVEDNGQPSRSATVIVNVAVADSFPEVLSEFTDFTHDKEYNDNLTFYLVLALAVVSFLFITCLVVIISVKIYRWRQSRILYHSSLPVIPYYPPRYSDTLGTGTLQHVYNYEVCRTTDSRKSDCKVGNAGSQNVLIMDPSSTGTMQRMQSEKSILDEPDSPLENDNAPQVLYPVQTGGSLVAEMVPRSADVGYLVTKVVAVDVDSGQNAWLSYKLQKATDRALFEVGLQNGEIRTIRQVTDKDAVKQRLTVIVEDNGQPSRSATVIVNVAVADSFPEVLSEFTDYTHDKEYNDNLTFYLVLALAVVSFLFITCLVVIISVKIYRWRQSRILYHSSLPVIPYYPPRYTDTLGTGTLQHVYNYEVCRTTDSRKSDCQVGNAGSQNVLIMDPSSTGTMQRIQSEKSILDEPDSPLEDQNDNAPQVLYPVQTGGSLVAEMVPRSVDVGYLVTKVVAVDMDSGQNAWLSYKIQKATDRALFEVGLQNGEIRTNRQVTDKDAVKQRLTVIVEDNGQPSRSATVIVNVAVADSFPEVLSEFTDFTHDKEYNDNLTFYLVLALAVVSFLFITCLVVIISVKIYRWRQSRILYHSSLPVIPYYPPRYSDTLGTGTLQHVYNYEVCRTTDSRKSDCKVGNAGSQNVLIMDPSSTGTMQRIQSEKSILDEPDSPLEDQNDNAPQVLYPVQTGGSLVAEMVPRSVDVGYLVTKVVAVDVDSGQNAWLSYKLQKVTDRALFEVGLQNGEIRTIRQVTDKDAVKQRLTVIVEDNGQPSRSATVIVNVAVADSFPEVLSEFTDFTHDKEYNDNLTFYLVLALAVVSFLFITCLVVIISVKIYRWRQSRILYHSSLPVIPYYPPRYSDTLGTGTLQHVYNYEVCRTTDSRKSDCKVGNAGSQNVLIMDPSSTGTMQRIQSEKSILDEPDSPLEDQNDNAPQVLYPVQTGGSLVAEMVPRSADVGYLVTKVVAVDVDSGQNAWLSYKLQKATDRALFEVGLQNGEIRTIRQVTDKDAVKQRLTVIVEDNGQPSRSATVIVNVAVADSFPEVLSEFTDFTHDKEYNDNLTFYLVLALALVSFLFITCLVVIISVKIYRWRQSRILYHSSLPVIPYYPPRYSDTLGTGTLQHVYNYEVCRTTDSRKSDCKVGNAGSQNVLIMDPSSTGTMQRIQSEKSILDEPDSPLEDQNDNAPQVLYPVQTGGSLVAEMVPRSVDVGYLVTKVVAVDVDSGQNAWLSYKLQKATDRALFEVGLQNGEIRTIRQVTDKDAVKQRLTVIVEDNGQPSRSATVIVNVAVADSFPEVLSEFTDFTHDKEYNDNLTFYLVLALAVVSFLFITCLVVIISVKIYRWRQSRILYHSSLPVIPYYPPRYSDTLGTGTLQHVYNYEVCRTTDSRKSDCKVGNAGSQNVLIMDPSSTGTMQRIQSEKSILDEPDSPLETYSAHVVENNEPGISIFTVIARDADWNQNAGVSYLLEDTQDQNDNAPQVLYPVQTGGSLVAEMVPRSADVGYLVTKVVAVDVDSGQNAWLSYKLQKATDRALFEVGLQNGEIRTIRQVTDKDAVKQRLTVIVEDNGQPSRSATVIVNVAVADSFPEVLSEFTDFTHDKEYNDNLTFYLVLALAVVSFLFITCLVVIISVKIYRWRQSRILYHSSLPVIPYYPPRYSDTLGTGTLQHVYNYEVCRTTDSRKSDCKVGNAGSQNVLIMDPSSTGTMQRIQSEKSILDEPDSPLESALETLTGIKMPECRIFWRTRSSNVSVKILIQDQNDNAPQVLYPVQTGGSLVAEMVPRSVDVGYLVTKVVAVDVDSGQNAWLSYKLQKATDRALFEVGLQNGEIRTIRQVTDKDAVKQRLTVIVEDNGQPSRSATVIVNVAVADSFPEVLSEFTDFTHDKEYNDNLTFYLVLALAVVSFLFITCLVVIISVKIYRWRQSRILYHSSLPVIPYYPPRYSDTLGTGTLQHVYNYEVCRTTDSRKSDCKFGNAGSQNVLIMDPSSTGTMQRIQSEKSILDEPDSPLEDQNDNAPQVLYPVQTGGSLVAEMVPRSADVGYLVTKVVAVDVDSGQNAWLSYKLQKATDRALFEVGLQNGEIRTIRQVTDKDAVKQRLTVIVEDNGQPSRSATVIVNVAVADSFPEVLSEFTDFTHDKEYNDNLTFYLVLALAVVSFLFITCLVVIISVKIYRWRQSRILYHSSLPVIPYYPPRYSDTLGTGTLQHVYNYEVCRTTDSRKSDCKVGNAGSQNVLIMDPSSTGTMQRIQSEKSILDEPDSPLEDQNDNAPQVLYPVQTGGSLVAEMVPRSVDVSYLVTKVVAVDVDSGQNAWLSYKLQKATDRALFEVGLQNGEIRTIRQVTDKDAVKQRLTVIVEDNGQPSRSATVIVNVAVADSFPEVLSEFTDFTHDKEYNDNLTFYLVLALAVVSFLFITCLVVIISVKIYRWRQSRILYHSSLPVIPYYPPRYSDTLGTGTLQHVYNYEVCRTTDSRKSDCKFGKAGSQNVLIMDPSSTGTMQRIQSEKSILDEPDSPLEDQNDNAPQVLYPVQTGGSLVAEMVPRSADVGYLVTKVVAVDVDSGQNAWLSYKLQKATDRALFEVGLQNGEIRTIRQVTDKDAVKQRLTVIVEDNGQPSRSATVIVNVAVADSFPEVLSEFTDFTHDKEYNDNLTFYLVLALAVVSFLFITCLVVIISVKIYRWRQSRILYHSSLPVIPYYPPRYSDTLGTGTLQHVYNYEVCRTTDSRKSDCKVGNAGSQNVLIMDPSSTGTMQRIQSEKSILDEPDSPLEDQNDNAPQVLYPVQTGGSLVAEMVPRSADVGYLVTKVVAVDVDSGQNAWLSYKLQKATDRALFEVGLQNGEIRTIRQVTDKDAVKQRLTVIVEDNGQPSRSATVIVNVAVADSFPEVLSEFTDFTHDKEYNDNLTFYLVLALAVVSFLFITCLVVIISVKIYRWRQSRILYHSSLPVIPYYPPRYSDTLGTGTLQHVYNYEVCRTTDSRKSDCKVGNAGSQNVLIMDPSSTGTMQRIQSEKSILDEPDSPLEDQNDNAPQVLYPVQTGGSLVAEMVPRSADVGYLVTKVVAVDVDSGQNAWLSYKLQKATDRALFEVGLQNGEIRTIRQVTDKDAVKQRLTVIVEDNGQPSRSATVIVNVAVADSFPEVLSEFTDFTHDKEYNDNLTFYLVLALAVVSFLFITCLVVIISVKIYRWRQSRILYHSSLPVIPYYPPRYSDTLGTGTLQHVYNYEVCRTTDSRKSDCKFGNAGSQNVLIMDPSSTGTMQRIQSEKSILDEPDSPLEDQNDNAPQVLYPVQTGGSLVAEMVPRSADVGYLVTKVVAVDVDSGQNAWLSYKLQKATDRALFEVGLQNGEIRTIRQVTDKDAVKQRLTVIVEDNGQPSRSATVIVNVAVADSFPEVLSEFTDFTHDKEYNDNLTFYLVLALAVVSFLFITCLVVIISVKIYRWRQSRILYHSSLPVIPYYPPRYSDTLGTGTLQHVYNYEVCRTTDSRKSDCKVGNAGSQNVLIMDPSSTGTMQRIQSEKSILDEPDSPLEDQNDNAPQVLYPVQTGGSLVAEMVPRSADVGYLVTKVVAVDVDSGQNAWLSYKLQKATDRALFEVGLQNGEIRTIRQVTDKDAVKQRLTVIVEDNGQPSRSATVIVNVAVADSFPEVLSEFTDFTHDKEYNDNLTFYLVLALAVVSFLFITCLVVIISVKIYRWRQSRILYHSSLPVIPYYPPRYSDTLGTGTLQHVYNYEVCRTTDSRKSDCKFGNAGSQNVLIMDPSSTGTMQRIQSEKSILDEPDSPLEDQNDNAPQVLYPVQTVGSLVAEMVPRSVDVGYLVTKVVAVDVDSGQNAWLSYKLQKSTDRALFEVGLQNGEIRTIRQVTDKDAVKQRLTVIVEDNGQPSRSATVIVNVAVADSFPEVLSEFTDFTHDKEYNDNLTFYLVLALAVVSFLFITCLVVIISVKIYRWRLERHLYKSGVNLPVIPCYPPLYADVGTGTLKHAFNYEVCGTTESRKSQLTECARPFSQSTLNRDHDVPQTMSRSTTHSMDLITESLYTVHVKENYPAGKILYSVSANDLDQNENAKLSYSILDSKVQDVSVSSYVYINSENGSIYSMHSFDYEKLKVFQIQVQAKDHGSPSLSSNATVHVFILDQNDNAPSVIYPSSAVHGSLSQQRTSRSSKAGHLVTKVTAVDADSGHNAWISYRLAEATDASLFAVNLYTGEVRTKRAVSEQDDSSQRLLIEIKDDGDPVQSTTVTVSVLLEDGLHEPILDLRHKTDDSHKKTGRMALYLILSLASVSVLSLVTFLILAVKCLKSSRSSGSCCMRRSDSEDYKNPNRNLQLQLNTDGPIKYVEVLGGDMMSQSQSFRSCLSPTSEYSDFTFVKPSSTTDFKDMINVLDASLPDSTWTFESQQTRYTIPEELKQGSVVGHLAKDLGLGLSEIFDRKLRVASEAGEQYFSVDTGKGELVVDVLDVNDNSPEVILTSEPNDVPEDAPSGTVVALLSARDLDSGDNGENGRAGTIIYSVSASDLDLGDNAKLSYSILDSKVQDVSVSSYVYINSENGSIYSMHSFDYEKLKVFQIQVQAKDHGSPSLSSNATVHVFILDQNDNAPSVIYPSSAVHGSLSQQRTSRSSKAGHLVTKVTAVDADSGHNAWISYRLAEATDASLFAVNLYTGEVRTKRAVSEQDDSSQRLLIEIKDDGDPVQSTTVTVSVLLEDGLHEPILDLRHKTDDSHKKTGRMALYLILSLASVSVLSLVTFLILAVKCLKSSRSSGSCCMRRSDSEDYKNPNRNLQLQLNTDGPIKYVEVLGGDMMSQSQSFRSCLSPTSEYSDFTFVKPSSTTDFKDMINVLDASLPDSTWTFESQQVSSCG
ncbi:unnamed protein product [Gadus morhua 'NCC']